MQGWDNKDVRRVKTCTCYHDSVLKWVCMEFQAV